MTPLGRVLQHALVGSGRRQGIPTWVIVVWGVVTVALLVRLWEL